MMGLSIWHILLFAVVVILLFGTSKLKNLGKDLGGAVKDFKDSVKTENDEIPAIEHNTKRVVDINNPHTNKENSQHIG